MVGLENVSVRLSNPKSACTKLFSTYSMLKVSKTFAIRLTQGFLLQTNMQANYLPLASFVNTFLRQSTP